MCSSRSSVPAPSSVSVRTHPGDVAAELPGDLEQLAAPRSAVPCRRRCPRPGSGRRAPARPTPGQPARDALGRGHRVPDLGPRGVVLLLDDEDPDLLAVAGARCAGCGRPSPRLVHISVFIDMTMPYAAAWVKACGLVVREPGAPPFSLINVTSTPRTPARGTPAVPAASAAHDRGRLHAADQDRRGRHGRGPPGPPRRRATGGTQGAPAAHRRRRRGEAPTGARGRIAEPDQEQVGRRDRRRRPVGAGAVRRDPLRPGPLAARLRARGGADRRART